MLKVTIEELESVESEIRHESHKEDRDCEMCRFINTYAHEEKKEALWFAEVFAKMFAANIDNPIICLLVSMDKDTALDMHHILLQAFFLGLKIGRKQGQMSSLPTP